MAKRKKSTTRTMTKRKTPRRPDPAVKKLRKFYKLGLDVLAADKVNPQKGKYSPGVSKKFATQVGKARDFVDKSRVFASKYTVTEFKELCALRRPDGKPLGPRHVIGLLRIKIKQKRKRLQRKAAIEGWSTRRVAAEVSKLLGTAGSGGRQAKVPADTEEALSQIITMTNRWERWFGGFDPEQRKRKNLEKSRVEVDDLPEAVHKQLKSAMKQIQKLKEVVEKELQSPK